VKEDQGEREEADRGGEKTEEGRLDRLERSGQSGAKPRRDQDLKFRDGRRLEPSGGMRDEMGDGVTSSGEVA